MSNAQDEATAAGRWRRWRSRCSFAVRERIFLLNEPRRHRRIAGFRRHSPDIEALLAAIATKRLIFTVTAGRTGTTFLARLFELFPDITSLHEPEPEYVYFLRRVQHRPALARRFLVEYKLPFIAGTVPRRYFEASHLFCKGFFEPLLELGVVPGIVILRRHPRLIATSFLTRRTVPGRGKLGLKYLVHPSDPGVLPLPDWTLRSDYQLSFWYALEIERRQHAYAEQLARAGRVAVDVTPDELRDGERFLEVAGRLGLLDGDADRGALLRRHAEVSDFAHNPNREPPVVVPDRDADEEAVWQAVAPTAPWLRAEVERRYPTPPD